MIETGFTYLRNMLAKVEITVKDNTRHSFTQLDVLRQCGVNETFTQLDVLRQCGVNETVQASKRQQEESNPNHLDRLNCYSHLTTSPYCIN